MKFIPQLQSLRFIAVLLVIVAHWVPNNIINKVPNGFIGVTFFFVLSGYLITTNLLYYKKSVDKKEWSIGKALKIFYFRRTLRIFPLYFAVIFLLYFLNKNLFLGDVIWYITYVPNFLIYSEQKWQGMLSHFWSLGVEEQFYIIWPILILFVKWEWLRYIFCATIAISIIFKIIVYKSESEIFSYAAVLPISCFDAFGIGAILAYFSVNSEFGKYLNSRVSFFVLFFISASITTIVFISNILFLFGLSVSITSVFVIIYASKGFTGFFGSILNNPLISYLGKISYGLYVFHNFMPWLWRCITSKELSFPILIPSFHENWLNKPLISIVAQFIILLIISSISWFMLEKPLNNMKGMIR